MLPGASIDALGLNDLWSVVLVEFIRTGPLVRLRLAGLVELVLEDHSGPSNRGGTNELRGIRQLSVDHLIGVEAGSIRGGYYDVVLRGIFIRRTRNRLRCTVDSNLAEAGFSSNVVATGLTISGLESHFVRATHRLEVAVFIRSHRRRDDILYLRVSWKCTNIALHVSGLTVRSGRDSHACINTGPRANLVRPWITPVDECGSRPKAFELSSGTGSIHPIVSIRW